jgi:hypothetical protein
MTIQELQTQLLSLTRDEKSSLIHFLSNSLETPWRGINKTPGDIYTIEDGEPSSLRSE